MALVIDEAHCVKLWGDQFRTAFFEIGNLRSIIPSHVKILALTATATSQTFQAITKTLSMDNIKLIASAPNRDNIHYSLHTKLNLEELSSKLCAEFVEESYDFVKSVLFVRQYSDCSDLYSLLQRKLGANFTHPPGYPNLSQFRQVEMFTRVLTTSKKQQILSSFSSCDSNIRLIIATSAFGLGVDIADIWRIMHWGLPSSIEEYVQESGRAGRDGNDAQAILFEGKGGKYACQRMKLYASNTTTCRRRLLFEDFLKYHEKDILVQGCKCCDLCAKSCSCDVCIID